MTGKPSDANNKFTVIIYLVLLKIIIAYSMVRINLDLQYYAGYDLRHDFCMHVVANYLNKGINLHEITCFQIHMGRQPGHVLKGRRFCRILFMIY
jgi:hypothetical protein